MSSDIPKRILRLNVIRPSTEEKQEPIKFKPIRKYTRAVVLERGKLIHGDKFDYTEITEDHVKSYFSEIPITCNTCNYHWTKSVASHINQRCGCPSCYGHLTWTLDSFLTKAKKTHGDKFNYKNVTKDHIKGEMSHIPVICNTCQYGWNPPINHHVKGTGCPQCYGNLTWTLDKFLAKANDIHGNKFDYTLVEIAHIVNQKSKVPIICNTCGFQWKQTITTHINGQCGCPQCYGNLPWTLERVLERAQEIHGDKYDYKQITHEHIKGTKSRIPIICKTCQYSWAPRIESHITNGTGCLDCAQKAPWTLERFLQKAYDVHRDRYNYTQVRAEHIQTYQSNVPVICNKCNHHWSPRIGQHVTNRTGCPICSKSHGELACINFLESRGIDYMIEFRLDVMPRKRYDLQFDYDGTSFILEFDGSQHFKFAPFFHINEEEFHNKQQIDTLKTQHAIRSGYCVIRIDYTQINEIESHLEKAIALKGETYFSTPLMYSYIKL